MPNFILFLFAFAAAGVVPCGDPKTSPGPSSIVQFMYSIWIYISLWIAWRINYRPRECHNSKKAAYPKLQAEEETSPNRNHITTSNR